MRYLMGHLRGAVSVPFKKLQGPDGRLGPPEQLAAAFGEVGLSDDATPVLYDHQDGRNAAMTAWVLEYLGRDDVHIMDLLFEGWKERGREVLYRPVPTEAKVFTPRLNAAVRATLDDAANPGRTKLLDTRSPEEFRGEVEMDHHPGHIPGAINLPHSESAGVDGKLLIDPDLLTGRLGASGITTQDSVVAYCRSGVRASLTYLAMKQAGYNVRLYDGSYAEWMDSGNSVEV
jgi:thiosulfate/3-mercaptopyruvate sulfurtransferase